LAFIAVVLLVVGCVLKSPQMIRCSAVALAHDVSSPISVAL
jgi:hypothetical protein